MNADQLQHMLAYRNDDIRANFKLLYVVSTMVKPVFGILLT